MRAGQSSTLANCLTFFCCSRLSPRVAEGGGHVKQDLVEEDHLKDGDQEIKRSRDQEIKRSGE